MSGYRLELFYEDSGSVICTVRRRRGQQDKPRVVYSDVNHAHYQSMGLPDGSPMCLALRDPNGNVIQHFRVTDDHGDRLDFDGKPFQPPRHWNWPGRPNAEESRSGQPARKARSSRSERPQPRLPSAVAVNGLGGAFSW